MMKQVVIISRSITRLNPESLHNLETIIYRASYNEADSQSNSNHLKQLVWKNDEIRSIIAQRRSTTNNDEKKGLSLKLKKLWRREKRKHQNQQFEKIHDELKSQDRLEIAQDIPIKRRLPKNRPDPMEMHQF